MPAIDTNSLMYGARCVDNCIPPGAQLPVLISIFAQIANMSLDPATLMAGARCVDNCVPVGMRMPVLISLAQQILDNGGGGGGAGGNANLIPDGTDPNGTETATQGLRYDKLGNVWLKTNGVNNATGWEKIISASSAMNAEAAQAAEEEAQPNAQWPTRTSAKAPLFVSGETLPASPQFVPVTLSEPRSSRMRRFLDALKTFVMNFFSFLPLILFLIIFSPSQSKAGMPPPLRFNWATTNANPIADTNHIDKLGLAQYIGGGAISGDLLDPNFPFIWTRPMEWGPSGGSGLTADGGLRIGAGNNATISPSGVVDGAGFTSDGGNAAKTYAGIRFEANEIFRVDAAGAMSVSNLTVGNPVAITLHEDGTSLFSGNITNSVLTANRAVVSDDNKALASSATTTTELGYVHGATSALQPQLDAKQAGPLTGAVTSSGAATSLGSFSSANLIGALTDESGSGLAIFQTSPAIITPTIASFVNATHTHQSAAGGGTLTLASAAFPNQGTTTTLLHGNAAGNPSWAAVNLANDVTGTLGAGSLPALGLGYPAALTNIDTRAIQLTNSLIVGTNGAIHATNALQVAVPTQRNVFAVGTNGTIYPNGHVFFSTDGTWDIGQSASPFNRPRAIFTSAAITIGSGFQLIFSGKGDIFPISDGVFRLANAAGTDFSRLQWGGTSAAFPSLKRVNGNLEVSDGAGTGTTNNFVVPGTATATNGFVWAATITAPVTLSNIVVTNVTLDFPSTAAGATSDLLVNIANVKAGDFAFASAPAASSQANSFYTAWVSNTFVYVQFHNEQLVSAIDPASGTFAVRVDQFK